MFPLYFSFKTPAFSRLSYVVVLIVVEKTTKVLISLYEETKSLKVENTKKRSSITHTRCKVVPVI